MKRWVATTLALQLGLTVLSAGCGGVIPEDDAETIEAEIAIVDDVAVMAVLVAGYVLVGGYLLVANHQLATGVKKSRITSESVRREIDEQVRNDNQSVQAAFAQDLNGRPARAPLPLRGSMTVNTLASRIVGSYAATYQREVAARIADSARRMYVVAKTSKFRNNGGGCVIATATSNHTGARFTGGAPFSSEFDVIAAQMSAGMRAYRRCALAHPEVVEAFAELIPQTPPDIDVPTFVEYAFRIGKLTREVTSACSLPSYAVTTNKAACASNDLRH